MALGPASAILGAAPGGGGVPAPVVSTIAQFTAQVDDLDLAGVDIARVSSDARREVTGIVAGSFDGRLLRMINVGSFPIALIHEGVASASANRIATGLEDAIGAALGQTVTLAPECSATLIYDATILRWKVVNVWGKDDPNFVWSFSGALTTSQNSLIPKLTKAHDFEVYAIRADVVVPPTGQSILVRVAGGSLNVVTTVGDGGLTSGFNQVNPPVKVNHTMRMTMTIEQVGSGNPGETLSVVAYTRPA